MNDINFICTEYQENNMLQKFIIYIYIIKSFRLNRFRTDVISEIYQPRDISETYQISLFFSSRISAIQTIFI